MTQIKPRAKQNIFPQLSSKVNYISVGLSFLVITNNSFFINVEKSSYRLFVFVFGRLFSNAVINFILEK